MKRNDITSLHQMTVAELELKLNDLIKSLTKAKLEKVNGKLTNVRLVSSLRDDVARVKSIMMAKVGVETV